MLATFAAGSSACRPLRLYESVHHPLNDTGNVLSRQVRVAASHHGGAVAKDLHDLALGGAAHGEVGACGVAQVVEAEVLEMGGVPHGFPTLPRKERPGLRVGRPRVTEDVVAAEGPHSGSRPVAQSLQGLAADRTGLGVPVLRVADAKEAVRQVDIRPGQAHELGLSSAGREGQEHQEEDAGAVVCSGGGQQLAAFVS